MDIATLRDMHREMTFEKVMETVPVYIETEFVGRDFFGEPRYEFLDVVGMPKLVYFTVIHADLDDHLELVEKLKTSGEHGIAYPVKTKFNAHGFFPEDLEAEFEEEGFLLRFTAYVPGLPKDQPRVGVEVLSVDIDEDLRECTFYCSAELGVDLVE